MSISRYFEICAYLACLTSTAFLIRKISNASPLEHLLGHNTERKQRGKKKPGPRGIQTHDLSVIRCFAAVLRPLPDALIIRR